MHVIYMSVFTRKKGEDSQTVFFFSVKSKRQAVEVHGVVLPVTSHIQEVPPHRLMLGHHQTRKGLCHMTIYCWRGTHECYFRLKKEKINDSRSEFYRSDHPPANLLLVRYQESSGLTWQGGAQYRCRFSSRYQLLVSSKVWKSRENSWMSGCVFPRVFRVPDLQTTSGPIRPEWRSFSCE